MKFPGSATSGFFCGMPDQYTVYFVAQFDRPFRAHGTWQATRLFPDASSAQGPAGGLADLRCNAEPPGPNENWTLLRQHGRRSRKSCGGSRRVEPDRHTRSRHGKVERDAAPHHHRRRHDGTAKNVLLGLLSHLLHPNVISDVTGEIRGFDSRVTTHSRHAEYANYSDWDIYRTEVPLLALIAPSETSDMINRWSTRIVKKAGCRGGHWSTDRRA